VWSPSGDQLIISGDEVVRIWDLSKRPLKLSGHTAVTWDAQWSPDGKRIATTSHDGTARIWDAASGQELLTLDHPHPLRFLAWSPDGTRIVTTSFDNIARVWDVIAGELLLEIPSPTGGRFHMASWSPDGSRFVAYSGSDPRLTVFDAVTGDPLINLSKGIVEREVHRPSWSPEGDWIVVASGPVQMWDAASGVLRGILRTSSPSVSAEWSPDRGRIVTGHEDGTVRMWGVVREKLSSSKALLTFAGHTTGVSDVTWSPDGKRFASSDTSGTVKVWDVAAGIEVLSFTTPGSALSVNWSPDGNYVIVAGIFKTPVVRRVWQSTEELIAHAKACCVARELTPEEREQFVLPER
jgi:WD40 repeat protein